MIPVQISDWRTYQRDGHQFLKTAVNAFYKEKKGFSHETTYNIICMGLEKLIMALLMMRGDLAENHTMADLLNALERHLGHNKDISDKLLYLDSFQQLCEIDDYATREPSRSELEAIVKIGLEIQDYLIPHLDHEICRQSSFTTQLQEPAISTQV